MSGEPEEAFAILAKVQSLVGKVPTTVPLDISSILAFKKGQALNKLCVLILHLEAIESKLCSQLADENIEGAFHDIWKKLSELSSEIAEI